MKYLVQDTNYFMGCVSIQQCSVAVCSNRKIAGLGTFLGHSNMHKPMIIPMIIIQSNFERKYINNFHTYTNHFTILSKNTHTKVQGDPKVRCHEF